MKLSKSIVLANVSLLLGIAAFCTVPSGCSGSSGGEEVSAPKDEATSAVAGGEADEAKENEATEAPEATEPNEPAQTTEAAKAPDAPKPADAAKPAMQAAPGGATTVAAVVQPCVKCHAGQAKANHVVKGVSCTTCHSGTEAHLKSPKTHPKTPSERADCFKCHAESAKVMASAPKQPDTHGEKEPCVSCHSIHDA